MRLLGLGSTLNIYVNNERRQSLMGGVIYFDGGTAFSYCIPGLEII